MDNIKTYIVAKSDGETTRVEMDGKPEELVGVMHNIFDVLLEYLAENGAGGAIANEAILRVWEQALKESLENKMICTMECNVQTGTAG